MSQPKSIQRVIKSNYQALIYLFGGLIFIIWLLATPTGIWGKADAVGYAVCHRIDVRSFYIGAIQLPLCVRCTGQYLGAVIALVLLSIYGRHRTGTPPKRVIVGMVFLIFFYAIDGLNSYFYLPPFIQMFPGMPHLYEPSNVLRLLSGTGMGLVIGIVLYAAFWGSMLIEPDSKAAISNLKTFFIFLGIGFLVDLLILTESKYVLFPAALVSTAGVLILLTIVYTMLWVGVVRKENHFTKLSQISRYLVVGFLITIIQIAIFDLIRFIITGSWNGIFFDQ
jgi:uncharacterized membrane protein